MGSCLSLGAGQQQQPPQRNSSQTRLNLTQSSASHSDLVYQGFNHDMELPTKIKNSNLLIAMSPFIIELAYLHLPTTQLLNNPKQTMNCLCHNILILNKYYYVHLESFFYGKESLRYCYENDVNFTLMKTQNMSIVYNLKSPTLNITALLDINGLSSISNRPFLSISNNKCCEYDQVIDFISTMNAIKTQYINNKIGGTTTSAQKINQSTPIAIAVYGTSAATTPIHARSTADHTSVVGEGICRDIPPLGGVTQVHNIVPTFQNDTPINSYDPVHVARY